MKGDINSRRNVLKRLKKTANMDLYGKIAQHGNEHLEHLWDFTPEDVLKVMTALINYCIEEGSIPDAEAYETVLLRQLEWEDGEGKIRLLTWAP